MIGSPDGKQELQPSGAPMLPEADRFKKKFKGKGGSHIAARGAGGNSGLGETKVAVDHPALTRGKNKTARKRK